MRPALDSAVHHHVKPIADSIASLSGHMTLVVIAHRLATIRDCDQIAYVEDGRLALADPLAKYLPEFAHPRVMIGGTADAPELIDATRPWEWRDKFPQAMGPNPEEKAQVREDWGWILRANS